MSLLQVQGLVKRFGGLLATDQLDLSVRAGEVHALIGPNGAGKTTLIQQLSGALASDAGRVLFDGADITRLAMHQRVRRGLARSYQITSIFPRLPVLDNVALALQAREGSSFRFWRAARNERERYEQAAAVLARVGLGARLDWLAGALSHGEQRQLEVGIALATAPKLLLLDEPMAGMGQQESERMVALLHSLRGDTTLLLVEHDMDAVFRLADTISVLVAGRVIASGTPDTIRGNAEVRRAYLGDDFEVHA
jgi:branched-chain amino acid transport system ATP-binding protein